MSDDLPPDLTPDEALAMEWALGLLEGAARRDAEERRARDPAFAALCARWQADLAPMSEAVAPVAPSEALWGRIAAEITAGEPLARPVTAAPAAAPGDVRAQGGILESLWLWRGATAALAALSVALLVTRPDAAEPVAPALPAGALLAATLAGEGGEALVTASLDTGRRSVVLAPVERPELAGRVPELWLIPEDGTPRSLGLIDLGGTQRLEVPATILELVAAGAVLAVSLEPAGGSPTGLPTGPVVATGRLAPV
ncbi:MAG: anti-sigma factor [Sphingomonadaceae bacterium]